MLTMLWATMNMLITVIMIAITISRRRHHHHHHHHRRRHHHLFSSSSLCLIINHSSPLSSSSSASHLSSLSTYHSSSFITIVIIMMIMMITKFIISRNNSSILSLKSIWYSCYDTSSIFVRHFEKCLIDENEFKIFNSQTNFTEKNHNLIVSIVPADGLAPLGARASAGTVHVMSISGSRIFSGPVRG